MAADFGEQRRSSALLRRVRALLREHDEIDAAARDDAATSTLPLRAGRARVAAHVREHRLDATRPYLVASVIVGDDGRPALHAHEPSFSGAGAVDAALLDEVDALLVGAGALRSGRFPRPVAEPRRRRQRRAHGLTLDPITIVISRHEVDVAALADTAEEATAPVLLYTSAPDPLSSMRGVEVIRMAAGDLRPSAALAHAQREHGVRTVLYHGGMRMLAALLADAALDELLLTIAPEIEPDPQQPPITELPGFAQLAAARVWETTAATVVRLQPELGTPAR